MCLLHVLEKNSYQKTDWCIFYKCDKSVNQFSRVARQTGKEFARTELPTTISSFAAVLDLTSLSGA